MVYPLEASAPMGDPSSGPGIAHSMSWLDEFSEAHGPAVDVVRHNLRRVERIFTEHLECELQCVNDLCARVESYRGKMLRPTLTLLSGMEASANADAEPTDQHQTLAAVVEMIHVATLVHDDVLDEAAVRRQHPTINKLRGNEAAVILGDCLISSAFHLCSTMDRPEVSRRIGQITTRVCQGELLQLHHRQDSDLDERTYFQIIERKTASLIGVACEQGAAASGADETLRQRLYDFGSKIGIAFQIQDDLLDLVGEERIVGKTLGKDLEKGKLTLPLIHHLAMASPQRREASLDLLRGLWRGDSTGPDRGAGGVGVVQLTDVKHEVRRAVESTGSIQFASERARAAVQEATRSLGALPANRVHGLLLELAQAVLSRDR